MDKNNYPYASYPKGFNKLAHDILPIFMWPVKKMMMRLLVVILKDG